MYTMKFFYDLLTTYGLKLTIEEGRYQNYYQFECYYNDVTTEIILEDDSLHLNQCYSIYFDELNEHIEDLSEKEIELFKIETIKEIEGFIPTDYIAYNKRKERIKNILK